MHAALAPLLVLLASAPPTEPPASEGPSTAPGARIGGAQLAPVFPPGSAAAAGKAAYDAGRHEEALAKLARAPEPEAAFVRALTARALDRNGEVLRALEGLESRLPEIADRIRFLRGGALAGTGRKREAMDAWAAVPEGSLLAAEARLERARAAASLGDREAALGALAPLLEAPAPPDPGAPDPGATALLLSGRIRSGRLAPDLAGARRDFLACWVGHPLSPEAPACLDALRSLAMPFGVPPGPEQIVERAEILIEANRSPPAIALLQPLAAAVRGAAGDAPLACRIRAGLGRAHRRERNNGAAIEHLTRAVAVCKDAAVRARALYVLAGARAASGDRPGAVDLYRQLAREYPAHSLADDALLFAAQLLLREAREGEAREALAAVVGARPQGDQVGEARFLLAWIARSGGALEEAVAVLQAIEKDAGPDQGYEAARAAYWRARILAAQAPAGLEQARAVWSDIAVRFPTDYYGLLARARLAETGAGIPWPRPPAAQREPSYDPGPLLEDPHLRAGLLLHRMGLPRAAAEELQAVPLSRLRPGDSLDPVLLVGDVLDRVGEQRAAHQLLRTRAREAFRRAPDPENLRAWVIAYPAAYRAEVQRYAAESGVPTELVQALMREESALDPRIVSPAGALGLTQLMLPTAQQVAARMRLARPTRGDLMQPALNIRIGARYLAELVRKHEGEVALALAAYNAGPTAVKRWVEAMPGLPLDEFVEQIPLEETRGYVKRVLRSYAVYATLYGEGGGDGVPAVFRIAGR